MSRPSAISPAQARFLRFFLAGAPDRAYWLADNRRLGKVAEPFAYEPEATHLLVYRLADGSELSYPGEPIDRRRLAVADLRPLWPLWADPIKRLTAQGEALARTRVPKRNRVCSFRQTETERALLAAEAERRGLPAAVIVAELVADMLSERPRIGAKTATAEIGKG